MKALQNLSKRDKVAILSPSFAAPAVFPEVYELGLKRLRDIFGLEPVEYPTTRKLGASAEDRAKDLIAAFEDSEIKAVISTIGGDDQITYIKNLPKSFVFFHQLILLYLFQKLGICFQLQEEFVFQGNILYCILLFHLVVLPYL